MSDKLLFPCPACQKRIRSRVNKAGQTVHCPQCNAAVVVPGTPPPQDAPPSPSSIAPPRNPTGPAPATRNPVAPAPAPTDAKPAAKPRSAPSAESRPVSLAKPSSPSPPPPVPPQLSKPPEPKPPEPKPRKPTISLRCGSCKTLVDAPVSLIGKSIRCPDCHSAILVTEKKSEREHTSSGDDHATTQAAHRGLGSSSQSFGFPCRLCGTRLYAEESQIGSDVTCPDCHSAVRVPPPNRTKPKAEITPPTEESSDDGEFRLEGVFERPKYQPTDQGKVSRDDMDTLQGSGLAPPPSSTPRLPDPNDSPTSPVPSAAPRARTSPASESPSSESPSRGAPPTQTHAAPPSAPPTAPRPRQNGVTFAAVCPHCHTRLGFRDDQIGKRVRCGDCHGEFVVKPQGKKAAPAEPPPADDDDDFALSAATVAPVIDPMAHESLATAESTAAATKAVDPLATASQEADDDEAQRVDIEQLGYFRRTLGFFADGEAVARCCLLALMDACMCWLISGGSQAAESDGLGQAMTIIYVLVGTMVFVPLALGTLANTFAITADTASGAAIVETWPEDIFSDWIGNSVTMFVICVVSGLPGSLMAVTLRELTSDPVLSTLFMGFAVGIGFCLVFPIVLLSVLEGDGLGSMVSPPVMSSLVIARKSWGLFYFETIVLSALIFPAAMVVNKPYFLLLLLASSWKFALVFVYYRLLGVLGCRVARALNEHHGNVSEDDED